VGGGTVLRNYALVPGLSLVKLPPGQSVNEGVLRRFNAPATVLYAVPDYIEQVSQSTTPDDPWFDDQWALYDPPWSYFDIDARGAWDYGTGSDDVIVAVIDSGIDYKHEDLADNMWINEAEANGNADVDDDDNGFVDDIYGYDFCTNDGDPCDSDPMAEGNNSHGTHCAGIIGAVGNNSKGIAGVCWTVRLMALRFIRPDGNGQMSDAISCIEYAVGNGAHVLNCSWGYMDPNCEEPLEDAFDSAAEANIVVVAAAGNTGGMYGNIENYPVWPACCDCDNIITVLATTAGGYLWGSSNYGATSVDLGAPGDNIMSCLIGDYYGEMEGTSMAAPHVAGACALLLSINPSLTYQEVKDILMDNVEPNGYLTYTTVSGGILNLYNAVTDARTQGF
jgi:subtilisin family serine protease